MIDLQERLQFQQISLEDASWAVPLLKNSGLNGCEFTFSTLYMWREYGKNRWARVGDTVFFRSDTPEMTFSPPVGGNFESGIALLRSYAHDQGAPLRLYGSAENLADRLEQAFPGQFDRRPSEPDFDYLYSREALATLPGKKYHGKRGHVAAFTKRYNWQYEAIDDGNLPDVLRMAEAWYQSREPLNASLRAEQQSIGDVLSHRKLLDVRGGLLRVDGRVAAFTFGAPVSSREFDIQVEKALSEYPGAYAVINKEFAARELDGFEWINRENDMGLEGLRKAKQSYHPARIIQKYICTER